MKCDEFLVRYQTGSALDRLLAGWHCRRCSRCSETRAWLGRIQTELAEPAELDAFHRQVWEQSTVNQVTRPAPYALSALRFAMVGALSAGILVMAVFWVSGLRNRGDDRVANNTNNGAGVVTTTIQLRLSATEAASLNSDMDSMAKELSRLAESAALLDARRAVEDLASAYPSLDPADSS